MLILRRRGERPDDGELPEHPVCGRRCRRAGGVEGVLHPQGLHRPHREQWRRGVPAGEAVGAARRHPRPAHPAARRARRSGADPRHRPRIARDHDDRHGRGARDARGRGTERGGRLRQAARPRRRSRAPWRGPASVPPRGAAPPRTAPRVLVVDDEGGLQGRARRVPRRQGLRGVRGAAAARRPWSGSRSSTRTSSCSTW